MADEIVGAAAARFVSPFVSELSLSRRVMTALRSGEAATQLEGQAAAAVGKSLTSFQRVVSQGGRVVGEIDVETTKAIVEVTGGQSPRKFSQVVKLMTNKTLNPSGKPVIVYGPNLGKQAAQTLVNAGAKVARTVDELKSLAQ